MEVPVLKIIFLFTPVLASFITFSAFALDCKTSQLLTDVVACRDGEISQDIQAINRYEQDFAQAIDSCKSKKCLRRLYKQKAKALSSLNPQVEVNAINDLTPDRAGVRELASYGKLEPLGASLYRKIADNEIFVFPYQTHNPDYEKRGLVKPFHFQYHSSSSCRRGIMDLECQIFLVLSPFDSLPEGLGGGSIDLFIPKDIPAPRNPGYNEIFYLDKTITELGYSDSNSCENSDDIFTLILCRNSKLQKQKNIGDAELAKVLQRISDKDDAYDLARSDFKMQEEAKQCPTVSCIEKKYADRIRYWHDEEYKKEFLPKALPQNCIIPELPADYELYGITNYGSGHMADFNLGRHHATELQKLWINRPEKNVVLVLSSYEPTVWDLHITPQTNLAAVFLGSHDKHMLRGVPDGTFVSSDCEIGYQEDEQRLKYKIRDIGLSSEKTYIYKDKTVIGTRLPDTEYHFADGIIGEGKPVKLLSGKYGIEQYVERRHLLPLERDDAYQLRQQGVEIASSVDNPQGFAEGLVGKPIVVCPELPEKYDCRMKKFLVCPTVPEEYDCRNRSYILLEAVDKLPNGLIGNEAIRLYVPKGLPVPENLGESRAYMLNQTWDEMKNSKYFKTVWGKYEN